MNVILDETNNTTVEVAPGDTENNQMKNKIKDLEEQLEEEQTKSSELSSSLDEKEDLLIISNGKIAILEEEIKEHVNKLTIKDKVLPKLKMENDK